MAKLLGPGKRRAASISDWSYRAHRKCWGYCDQWNRTAGLPNDSQSRWMELVSPFLFSIKIVLLLTVFATGTMGRLGDIQTNLSSLM